MFFLSLLWFAPGLLPLPAATASGYTKLHRRLRGLEESCVGQVDAVLRGSQSNDLFGRHVSINADGSIVAVGAEDYNGVSGNQTGLVQVFEKDSVNNQWKQLGRSIEGDSKEDWLTANALSDAGNILAVGAWGNDDAGDLSGQVRVYKYTTGEWQQRGDKIIGDLWDYVGWSLALSGDGNILAVGAPAYIDSGKVLVFEWKGVVSGWVQKGSTIEGSTNDDNFGYSISISQDGNILALGSNVGNVDESGAGKVQIFEFANNDWVQLGNNIESDSSGDEFGYSVSLSSNGHSVAIGAKNSDLGGNGYHSGQVRVFELVQSNGSATWSQLGQALHGDAPFDYFGESVSLAGGDTPVLAVGAVQDGAVGPGSSSGFVRLFRLEENNWQQIGDDVYSNLAEDDLGGSVAISRDGSTVVAGGDAGGSGHAGTAIVYNVCPPGDLPSPIPSSTNILVVVAGTLGGVAALFAVAAFFFFKHKGSVKQANGGKANQSSPTERLAGRNDDLADYNADLDEPACQLANVLEVFELSSVRPSDVAEIQVDNDGLPPRQNIQNRVRRDPPAAIDLHHQTTARHNTRPPTKKEHSDHSLQQLQVERRVPEFKDQVQSCVRSS